MKDKIVGILVCIMLVLTAIVIVPGDLKVEATSGGGIGRSMLPMEKHLLRAMCTSSTRDMNRR